MKVWVCRESDDDEYSGYVLMRGPKKNFSLRGAGFWSRDCGAPLNTEIGEFCPKEFKEMTGLKKHLEPGTCKRMTWRKPFEGEG